MRRVPLCALWLCRVAFSLSGTDQPVESSRPVTVEDTISMTEIVDQGSGLHDFMQMSPNSDHFFVIVERGDVKTNERVFSLLVFRTAAVLDEPGQDVAVLRTSTNEDAIADVRWLDNETLTFLGNTEVDGSQVYAVDIKTKQLRALTRHTTKINGYAVAPGLGRVIYTADAELTPENEEFRRHGFTVTDQSLIDVVMGNLDSGRLRWRILDYEFPQETFIRTVSSGKVVPLPAAEQWVVVPNGLFPYSRNPISPDGRYAVLQGLAPAGKEWQCYPTPFPSTVEGTTDPTTFFLVDLESGISSRMIDAPASPYLGSVVWSPDARAVVLVNTFLPNNQNGGNCSVLSMQTVIAEVDISSRQLNVIHGPAVDAATSQGVICAQGIDWKPGSRSLALALSRSPDTRGGVCDVDQVATYERDELGWHETKITSVESALRSTPDGSITISLDQGLNTPPNLKAFDRHTGRTKIFTDFNPQFRSLRLAPVTLITWTARDGSLWAGDLYIAPNQDRSPRTPLVIQTHGCTTDKFDVTGFGPGGATGYAAQPLAARGITVLQVGRCVQLDQKPRMPTPYYSAQNAEREMLGFESAIDLLDKRGIIDRNRVGLQGHSATAWTVVYAAAHPKPKYPYAAVLSTARGDLGYFSYLATTYGRSWSSEGNGAQPVGSQFEVFRRNALPFNLERVESPIMSQEPDGLRYVPLMWEIHENLKLLGKPEEFMIFPDGTHNLVKPWERLASGQAAVDWFCFWLKGEEDPAPQKKAQYERWNAMRHLLERSKPDFGANRN